MRYKYIFEHLDLGFLEENIYDFDLKLKDDDVISIDNGMPIHSIVYDIQRQFNFATNTCIHYVKLQEPPYDIVEKIKEYDS